MNEIERLLRENAELRAVELLAKRFTPVVLAERVRNLLDSKVRENDVQ